MPLSKNASPNAERLKRVTLQDIAEVAGVKNTVVSNALNGTRSVAPATRAKILQIAKEMNYIPNFAALSPPDAPEFLLSSAGCSLSILCHHGAFVGEAYYGQRLQFDADAHPK
jgi:transcriptional regulator with XRE-family HTH domain